MVEARISEKVLSSYLVLIYKSVLYYKFGASDPGGLIYRPNNALFWDLLRYASENGLHTLDLGLSLLDGTDDGLIRFKEGMGGVSSSMCLLRHDPVNYNHVKEKGIRKMLRNITQVVVETELETEQIDQLGRSLFHLFI